MGHEPGIDAELEDALSKAVRSVDPAQLHGKRVYVYRNLHNGLFSVWHRGRVIAHLPEVHLKDAEFRVRESGRQKVLKEKRKNVHAFVIGTIDHPQEGASVPVTYNPYMHPPDQPGSFVRAHDKAPVKNAARAHLAIVNAPDGKQRASMNIQEHGAVTNDIKKNIDSESKPPMTHPVDAGLQVPVWLGRMIAHKDHATQLEHDAAINEFRDRMPRGEAEEKAYADYQKAQHIEAAAHHLAGMKAAHAAGDMEAARKHSLMYNLHSKSLGHEPVGPAHPGVVAHMEKKAPKVYRFKAHRGDLFAIHGETKSDEGMSKAEVLHAVYSALEPLIKGGEGVLDRARREIRACMDSGKHLKSTHPNTRICSHCNWSEKIRSSVSGGGETSEPKTGHLRVVKTELAKLELTAWARKELAERRAKRSEKPKVVPCRCTAYSHPHRTGGGKCSAGK